MQSGEIVALLRKKHEEDVFVAECKDGPTVYGSHLRMDAWAMRKSWANPLATAYEVKVSRGDFLRDDKWRGYLAYCNEFYFVCPDGLIRPEEVPESAGLLWVAKTGSRLFKKRKAPTREVAIPDCLYRYLLFSRVQVDPPRIQHYMKLSREYWEEWLTKKRDDLHFGRMVGKRLWETIETRIHEVDRENRRLKDHVERMQDIAEFLKELGIDPRTSWLSRHTVEHRLEQINRIFSPRVIEAIDKTLKGLEAVKAEVQRAKTEAGVIL